MNDLIIKSALKEMMYEFLSNRLEVGLVPQSDPPNAGACLRKAISYNAEWYRMMCADFPSHRKRQYRNFKTAVKRKDTEQILRRLIDGKKVRSKYADWMIDYAKHNWSTLYNPFDI